MYAYQYDILNMMSLCFTASRY